MKNAIALLMSVYFIVLSSGSFAQGVSVNSSGNVADPSAIMDVSSTTQGALIPRMTTAQRNTIANPALALQIYNTTTNCFEFYANGLWQTLGCACTVPSAVTAMASPNPVCAGTTLALTGAASGATGWSWTGPNGFTSSAQSPSVSGITAAGAGIYTLTATNACGSAAPESTQAVVISDVPGPANAGADINPSCGQTTATLSANTPSVGTGTWSVVSGAATITNPNSPTSGVTGLAVAGSTTLRWTITNAPCTASYDDVVITTAACFSCGNVFTDSRDAQTYTTVQIGTQCWMSQNLNYGNYTPIHGVPQLAGEKYCQNFNGVNDNSCPMGGLYDWQNMMAGSASCNGTGSGQPACTSPVQGLCPVGWHIPSHYEWTLMEKNVGSNPGAFPYDVSTTGWRGTDEGGNLRVTPVCGTLPCWSSPNTGATNSSGFNALPGGHAVFGTFEYVPGNGQWWSSTDNGGSDAWLRYLNYTLATVYRDAYPKSFGLSIRCVKD